MKLLKTARLPTACIGPPCQCADAPIGTSRRLRLAFLVLVFSAQACTSDLARLPDSAFTSHARLSHERQLSPVSSPAATPVSAKQQSRRQAEATPVDALALDTLTEATDAMLQRYRYIEQAPTANTNGVSPAGDTLLHTDSIQGQLIEAGSPVSTYSLEAFETSLQALLFSLAADAGIQLQINGSLDAQVTVNAVEQPLEEIMATLALQAGVSWQLRHEVLTVWSGDAYSHSYPINYLNIHRRTQSSVGLATQVGTINASNSSGGSIANSSQTQVENISEHLFWDSLDADLKNIISRSDNGDAAGAGFSINKEAGLLTLHAKPHLHRDLQRYLEHLQASTQRQVLIEATVIEVALSDSFDAGVDWQLLAKGISGFNASQLLVGAPTVAADTIDRLTAPGGLVSLVQQSSKGDLRATLSLLEQFGDVRILSRPRIIALNNQSSVLKVVDNRVYFTLNVQRRQTEDDDEIITETEIHTVPVGLVMNVTPQISEQGMVMLNVRPTLSRILGFVNDPNPELALANVQNGVPEIQVREMESMLQVRSGDVAIIGGLMQETQSDNDARLPGLGRLPGIGKLFSKTSRERRQTELLIVLRPTVLGDEPTPSFR